MWLYVSVIHLLKCICPAESWCNFRLLVFAINVKISIDCVARNLEQIVKCLRLDTSTLSQVSKFDGVALEICGLGRSIRSQMFFIIGVLNPLIVNGLNISKYLQENTCVGATFLIKLLQHRRFPVNIAKF